MYNHLISFLNIIKFRKYLFYSVKVIMKKKFRGSIIGPLWNVIGAFVLITVLSIVYGKYFFAQSGDFLSYLSISLFTWVFIANSLNGMVEIFNDKKNILLESNHNHKIFIFENMMNNFYIYLYTLPVIFLMFIFININININFILSIPAIILIVVNVILLGNILSILSPIYRDVPKIVENLLVIGFFSTPIIWYESILSGKSKLLLYLNPFYYFFKILRDPFFLIITKQYFFYLIIVVIITLVNFFLSFYVEKKFIKSVKLYI